MKNLLNVHLLEKCQFKVKVAVVASLQRRLPSSTSFSVCSSVIDPSKIMKSLNNECIEIGNGIYYQIQPPSIRSLLHRNYLLFGFISFKKLQTPIKLHPHLNDECLRKYEVRLNTYCILSNPQHQEHYANHQKASLASMKSI